MHQFGFSRNQSGEKMGQRMETFIRTNSRTLSKHAWRLYCHRWFVCILLVNFYFSKYFDFCLVQMHYNFYLNYLVLIQKKVHWKLVAMLLSLWFQNLFFVFIMMNLFFRCIVSSINDPNVYVMDHLLLLEPVKILEGEPIHKVNFDVYYFVLKCKIFEI